MRYNIHTFLKQLDDTACRHFAEVLQHNRSLARITIVNNSNITPRYQDDICAKEHCVSSYELLTALECNAGE